MELKFKCEKQTIISKLPVGSYPSKCDFGTEKLLKARNKKKLNNAKY